MIIHCLEIPTSIFFYFAYGCDIFAWTSYRGRKDLDLSFGLADQQRYLSSRQLPQHHDNLGYISTLPKRLKDERESLKFCKIIYRFAELKRILSREIDTIDKLMEQDERSRKVKSSIQKLQETKTKPDRAYENACGMLKAESVGSLSTFEKDNKISLKIHKRRQIHWTMSIVRMKKKSMEWTFNFR